MEAKLQKLENTLDEVKASLQDIKLENSSVRKHVEGKKVLHVTNGESSDDLAEKSLRDLVEEISFEVKNISHHVQGNNYDGPAPVIGFPQTDSVSYSLEIGGLRPISDSCPIIGITPLAEFLPEQGLEESPGPSELFVPLPSDADNEVDNKVLQLKKADLNINDNGKEHRTGDYSVMEKQSPDMPQLVVRRGQEFSLRLEFHRAYAKDDVIRLTFYLADTKSEKQKLKGKHSRPQHTQSGKRQSSKHYSVVVVYVGAKSTNDWDGHVDKVNGNEVTIKVKASPSCPVGKWMLEAELSSSPEQGSARGYELTKPIYIIFNPWCKLDDTYYPDEEHLRTYVLSDYGTVYKYGTGGRPYPKRWHFHQFEDQILDCALHLFKHPTDERGNVVKVTRRLTSVINSIVLAGKWNGSYDEGVKPSHWNGSKDILQQYYNTRKAVRYGQCWVFAGVLNTVCRALGIPCRTVTNYDSFHEKGSEKGGYTFTVDSYFDAKGKPIRHHAGAGGSPWNFHVWNEAWMRRADLPAPYTTSGWQAIDSTPQEDSKDYYKNGDGKSKPQMGPAPVAACKAGDVHINYDVGFVFGEVNADNVAWRCYESKYSHNQSRVCERIEPIQISSTDSIGRDISTESLKGHHEREDITDSYKFPEGDPKERDAMRSALRNSSLDYARVLETKKFSSDVTIKAKTTATAIGRPIEFQIIVKNKGKERYSGNAWVQVYSGAPRNESIYIMEKSFEFDLEPGKDVVHDYVLEFANYRSQLTNDDKILQVDYTASVNNTDIAHFGKSYFELIKPKMTFSVPEEKMYVNRGFEVTLMFKNMSHHTLEGGKFTIDATGCKHLHQSKMLRSELKPDETTSVTFELVPSKAGKMSIAANFSSPDSHYFEAHSDAVVDVIMMD